MGGVGSLHGFLAMLALNLADIPEAREAVVANPDLLPDAIEELLAHPVNDRATHPRRQHHVPVAPSSASLTVFGLHKLGPARPGA